jgi:hypothetical protein
MLVLWLMHDGVTCQKADVLAEVGRPSYLPNPIKRRVLYGRYTPRFADFQAADEETLDGLATTHAKPLSTLMTRNFSNSRMSHSWPCRVEMTEVASLVNRDPSPRIADRIIARIPARMGSGRSGQGSITPARSMA